MTTTKPNPTCIASDTVPLWECPCRECTKLDYDITIDDESRPTTLAEFRHLMFPEIW